MKKDSKKEKMQKIYVLDTNVLIHDPSAIYAYPKDKIVIPITVIEEIDQFKKDWMKRAEMPVSSADFLIVYASKILLQKE